MAPLCFTCDNLSLKKKSKKEKRAGASRKGKCLGHRPGLECTHSQKHSSDRPPCQVPGKLLLRGRKEIPQVSCDQTDQGSEGSIVCSSSGLAEDGKNLLTWTTVRFTTSHSVLLWNSHLSRLKKSGGRPGIPVWSAPSSQIGVDSSSLFLPNR